MSVSMYLLTTNFFLQYYVRNMTDDAHDHFVVHQDLKNVVSMDYHYKNGDLYYADVSAKTIYRFALHLTQMGHPGRYLRCFILFLFNYNTIWQNVNVRINWCLFMQDTPWSSLVEGDEGCIGPNGKVLCL